MSTVGTRSRSRRLSQKPVESGGLPSDQGTRRAQYKSRPEQGTSPEGRKATARKAAAEKTKAKRAEATEQARAKQETKMQTEATKIVFPAVPVTELTSEPDQLLQALAEGGATLQQILEQFGTSDTDLELRSIALRIPAQPRTEDAQAAVVLKQAIDNVFRPAATLLAIRLARSVTRQESQFFGTIQTRMMERLRKMREQLPSGSEIRAPPSMTREQMVETTAVFLALASIIVNAIEDHQQGRVRRERREDYLRSLFVHLDEDRACTDSYRQTERLLGPARIFEPTKPGQRSYPQCEFLTADACRDLPSVCEADQQFVCVTKDPESREFVACEPSAQSNALLRRLELAEWSGLARTAQYVKDGWRRMTLREAGSLMVRGANKLVAPALRVITALSAIGSLLSVIPVENLHFLLNMVPDTYGARLGVRGALTAARTIGTAPLSIATVSSAITRQLASSFAEQRQRRTIEMGSTPFRRPIQTQESLFRSRLRTTPQRAGTIEMDEDAPSSQQMLALLPSVKEESVPMLV